MQRNRRSLWLLAVPLLVACARYREDVDYHYPVEYAWQEPGMHGEFSLFQGVAWDSAVSQTLRPLITEGLVGHRTVLDLFSGPGVIAVTCGHEGAKSVLSLAESEVAAACARYNVAAHGQDSIVTIRRLDRQASPVLPSSERFDVILATLTSDASETTERDIEILLECVAGNLELSGRALVVCKDLDRVGMLEAACHKRNLAVVHPAPSTPAPASTSTGQAASSPSPSASENPLLPICEIKHPPTSPGAPAAAGPP
ncbi:MAG: hypothetical protein ACO1RT_01860 [Planctomycetaceae bacterium]